MADIIVAKKEVVEEKHRNGNANFAIILSDE